MALPLHLPAVEFTGFVAHVLKTLLLFSFSAYTSQIIFKARRIIAEGEKKHKGKLAEGKQLQIGETIQPTLEALEATENHTWFAGK